MGLGDAGNTSEFNRINNNFITGGNENPTAMQPGPISRAEQVTLPWFALDSPGGANFQLLANPSQSLDPRQLADYGSLGSALDPATVLCSAAMTDGKNILRMRPQRGAAQEPGFFQELSEAADIIGTFMVGVGDGVSGGLTNDVREYFGTNDVVKKDSLAYGGGVVAGVGLGFALGFAGGATKGACLAAQAVRGYNTLMTATAVGKAGYNLATGRGTAMDAVTLGLPLVGRGLGAVAGRLSSTLRNMGCFAAGTHVLTPDGSKAIEDLRPGDWIIAAPDDDPEAEPAPRQVEAAFANHLPLLALYLNGRPIQTTAEHPFWVKNQGWVPAQQLVAGDQLRIHNSGWITLERVDGPQPPSPVYNVSVTEYHTYFVGHPLWGLAVWTHNAGDLCNGRAAAPLRTFMDRSGEGSPQRRGEVEHTETSRTGHQSIVGRHLPLLRNAKSSRQIKKRTAASFEMT